MPEDRFKARLQDTIRAQPFDLEAAEKLSDEIHAAESLEEYDISDEEDDLWGDLTELILDARLKHADPKR